MRTTPRALLTISLCGIALTLAGCSPEAEGDNPTSPSSSPTSETTAPTSEPTQEETASPSPEPTEDAADATLIDGSQEVEIQSIADTYLAPTVEGGVALVSDPATNEVPAQWIIGPVEAGGDDFQLTTVALTDGEPMCLTVPAGGDPSLATCDSGDASQVFSVTTLDRPDQVAVSNEAGHLGVDADGASLTVHPTGEELSSTFTLISP
ncbi:hypothetical protein [Nesterenkonia ebinurensis]|uniref:hypothetical protein n=1 Tax=Nesterenkonia ebinurensis TaxID=2608252 RepID=UPI001CC349D6|nr:hypothetical protein [Nesterenkonia ebinurensis]